MLAEVGCAAADPRRRPFQPQRGRQGADQAPLGVLDLRDDAARRRLRVGQCFVVGQTGSEGMPALPKASSQCALSSRARRSWMIPISAGLFATRSALVAKRGSETSSGRPISSQSDRQNFSFEAPTVIHPSRVRNTR